MKALVRIKPICTTLLIWGMASAHAISIQTGGDDFNDNSVDPAKWASFHQDGTVAFTEINQRLEYTSTSTAESFIEWAWNGDGLSYTQDWSVAVDVAALFDGTELTNKKVGIGMAVLTDAGYWFNLDFSMDEYGPSVGTYAGDPLDNETLNAWGGFVSTNELILKIAFDAQTKKLYSSYSIGGSFIALTNYSVLSFGMTDSLEFTPTLLASSESLIVPSGKVHLDNFRILEPVAAPNQTISQSGGDVVVGFNTISGLYYELWASTNLVDQQWTGPLHTTSGSNNLQQASIPVAGYSVRYFQVRGFELAPEPTAFQSQVVGTFLPNTATYFTSPTRFIWDGTEAGNWSYTKTGLNAALLVFTYDEDGNDPSIYREEIVLTYTGKDTGTFRYSEFNGDVEDPVSISTGPFTFN